MPLVLLGLGDFFDETCLFHVKPHKPCLSRYLTEGTGAPVCPLFIYSHKESYVKAGCFDVKTLNFTV